MALVEATPSVEMRVIWCLKFDRRAPFDAVARFKQDLLDCASVVHSVEASGAFDFMIEAALPDFVAYQALIEQFSNALNTLVERQEASFVCRRFLRTVRRDQSLWVPSRDGRRRIYCATIDLVRAEGDYVRIYSRGKSWLLHVTMHHLRETLDPELFLTLHRSTIVNADFVERLVHRRQHWVALLRDGTEVRIAKSHVVDVLTALRTDSSMDDATSPNYRIFNEISAPLVEEEVHQPVVSTILL